MTDIIEIPKEAVVVGRTAYSEGRYHVQFRIGDNLYGTSVGAPSKQELGTLLEEYGIDSSISTGKSMGLKSL